MNPSAPIYYQAEFINSHHLVCRVSAQQAQTSEQGSLMQGDISLAFASSALLSAPWKLNISSRNFLVGPMATEDAVAQMEDQTCPSSYGIKFLADRRFAQASG